MLHNQCPWPTATRLKRVYNVSSISALRSTVEYRHTITGSRQNVPGGIDFGSETTVTHQVLPLVEEILSIRSEGHSLSVMDLIPTRDEPGRKLK